jgi:hypothetical protein
MDATLAAGRTFDRSTRKDVATVTGLVRSGEDYVI